MSIDDFELSKQRIRESFNKKTRIDDLSRLEGRAHSIAEIRRLDERSDDIRTKMKDHYGKYRDQWVEREINEITEERFRPSGVDHYKPGPGFNISGENPNDPDIIRRDAEQRVELRFQQRMERVDDIQERMTNDIISHSRDDGWSR